MDILQKQQVDIDIANIEASANTFVNAINAAIFSLNDCHYTLWSLPDDRLTTVLQKLHDNNQLMPLFVNHNYSAVSLNEIKVKSNSEGIKAIDIAGKQFQIVDGIVSLVPLPVIEQEVIEEIIQPQIEEVYQESTI